MAEHTRVNQSNHEDVEQKHRSRQQESQPSSNAFHAWDQGIFTFTDTPFSPQTDQHAAWLVGTHSAEHQAKMVLQLQQLYGNTYVQRLLNSTAIQAKLTVNAPNDVYEQEADRVAEAVNRTTAPSVQWQEEEEDVRTMPLRQRQGPEREEQKLHMKLDTGRVGQEGSQVDPEVESALQEGRYGRQPIHGKVQRMAVAATDNIANVTDALVWNNLEHGQTKAGGPVGDLKANLVWSQLKRGEEVRIVGHGTETTGQLSAEIKMHDAKDIKDSMTAGGLDAKKNPKAPKLTKLIFQSCFAGKKRKVGQNLIQEMTAALTDIGQSNVDVYGRPGIAFGFKGMGGKTAKSKKAYFETMAVMQSRNPLTKGGVYIFKAKDKYNDPWMMVKTSKKKWDTWTTVEKMGRIAMEMEDYWKGFNTEMEKRKGFFKKPEDAIKELVS